MLIVVLSIIGNISIYGATPTDFLNLSYTNPVTKKVMKYRLFVPKNYDEKKKYPLVGFLHGAGEGDSKNTKQLTANAGCMYWASDSIQSKYPSFVLEPNTDGNNGFWASAFWGDGNFDQDKFPISESLDNYIKILKDVQTTYSIDLDRTYSTGLSMGGGGTWAIITRFPDLFAAAIPICGYGDPNKMILVKSMPIWTFHGSEDGIISVETTRALVQKLKAIGGNIKYSEMKVGHGIWDNAYACEKGSLADWLFAQKRVPPTATVAAEESNIIIAYVKSDRSVQINNATIGSEIQIIDLQGRVLLTNKATAESTQLQLAGVPNGAYILKVGTTTKKLLVE